MFQTDIQTLTNFPLFLGSTNNNDETSKTIFNHYTFTILKEVYLRKETRIIRYHNIEQGKLKNLLNVLLYVLELFSISNSGSRVV